MWFKKKVETPWYKKGYVDWPEGVTDIGFILPDNKVLRISLTSIEVFENTGGYRMTPIYKITL